MNTASLRPLQSMTIRQIKQRKRAAAIQREALRSKCVRRISAIVEIVATARSVPWESFFTPGRGSKRQADARVLAMAICCAMDIPQYMVARAFSRSWASVFAAEKRASKKYRESAEFRKEWDNLTHQAKP